MQVQNQGSALGHNAPRMLCPRCHAGMEGEVLDARLGTTVSIDVCRSCQVLWFDSHEDLQLAPASTLKLFRMIAKHADAPAATAPGTEASAEPACPWCDLRLLA